MRVRKMKAPYHRHGRVHTPPLEGARVDRDDVSPNRNRNGDAWVIELLREAGAPLAAKALDGSLPLHIACALAAAHGAAGAAAERPKASVPFFSNLTPVVGDAPRG